MMHLGASNAVVQNTHTSEEGRKPLVVAAFVDTTAPKAEPAQSQGGRQRPQSNRGGVLDPSLNIPSRKNPLLDEGEIRIDDTDEKKDIFVAGVLFGAIIVLSGVAGYKLIQYIWKGKGDVAETLKSVSETSTP